MGMFDYIKIDYPLPIEDYVPKEYKPFIYAAIDQDGFQTKDLECCLNHYYVDNRGFIYLAHYPDFESNEEIKYQKTYFHGHIIVYTMVHLDDRRNNKIWLQYDLKFTDSLLIKATTQRPTAKDIKELHTGV